jgi:hypothetical protein
VEAQMQNSAGCFAKSHAEQGIRAGKTREGNCPIVL